MYYEIYVDALFLVNFVMNLYLLLLTDFAAGRSASRLRLAAGALSGAAVYCLCLVAAYVPPWLKMTGGTVLASALMVKITFRPSGLRSCMRLTESLAGYSFLMGGILLALMRYVEGFTDRTVGTAGIMGAGGIAWLVVTFFLERRKKEKQDFCRVTLVEGENSVQVDALIDTGNGLTEPISGKPVSVVQQSVLEKLWPQGLPELYRAVPYHSVGCEHGIMKGYLAGQMVIERQGLKSTVCQVYLGAGENKIAASGSYGMLLNPRQLQAVKTAGKRRKGLTGASKRTGRDKNDTESGAAGKGTIQDYTQGKKFSAS